MNVEDTENNCVLLADDVKTQIGNSKLTTKAKFYRLFETTDPNGQDIKIEPGMKLAFQVKVEDVRIKPLVNPQFLTDFIYQIPILEMHHSTLEINLIVAALFVGSFSIILIVRWIELRGEKKNKEVVIKKSAP